MTHQKLTKSQVKTDEEEIDTEVNNIIESRGAS